MENNEDSIWDKDDENEDGEHSNNCGHTDAEHAEMKKQALEKRARLQKNFKKFLADNAEDMLDDGMFEKIQKSVAKHLRDANASASYTSLKIFHEGFVFGMMTQLNVGSESSRVMAGINRMIKDKEPKKTQIDITKSMPLPPKEDNEKGKE